MACYRYQVEQGEFVLQGDRYWQLTFNGMQIGSMYRTPHEALDALRALRQGQAAGPDLDGIADPPSDFRNWGTLPSIVERYAAM